MFFEFIVCLLISSSYSFGDIESSRGENWICSYCNATAPVIRSTGMLRVHDKGVYDISNENTADFLGEMQFCCYFGGMWYNLTQMEVTLWNISYDARFGPYGQCDIDECDIPDCPGGYSRPFVGRARAENFFKGQCDPTSAMTCGIWWALYDKYECKDDKQVIGVDCAWKDNGIVKSIDYLCLEKLGTKKACQETEKGPFPKARDILVKAFQSSDMKKGGCPNVHYK